MNILVFDKSEKTRLAIKRGITFTLPLSDITEADNNETVVDLVNREKFDLLILDLDNMKGNLLDVVEIAERFNKSLVIIVLTNFSNPKVSEKLLRRGIAHYYNKVDEFSLFINALHSLALSKIRMQHIPSYNDNHQLAQVADYTKVKNL